MAKQSPDDIVLCKTFETEAEAYIACGALKAAGIRSVVDNSVFGSVLPIGFNSIGAFRLMVFRKDLPQARQLLSEGFPT